MKIAIVNTYIPFLYGGAEYQADSLCQAFNENGYQSMVVKIPFCWHPDQKILDSMLAARLISLQNIDKVIALRFPAFYANHPNKIVWALHQFRQAYDLWGTPYQGLLANTPAGHKIREAIINSDNRYLGEAKKIFTISEVTSARLKKFNNLDSEVLYPPLGDTKQFYCQDFSDYIFYPSRISNAKRQHLAVEAMRYTRSKVKLIIAGAPDESNDVAVLRQKIEKHNLSEKITLFPEWISQQKKIELMANCLGCVYIPYDEDFGYVSFEAFYSKKAVITCKDSGWVLNVVQDKITGLVVEPDPEELAASFDDLYHNKKAAQRLGECGYELVTQMDITWENVIRKLIQ